MTTPDTEARGLGELLEAESTLMMGTRSGKFFAWEFRPLTVAGVEIIDILLDTREEWVGRLTAGEEGKRRDGDRDAASVDRRGRSSLRGDGRDVRAGGP